RSSDLDGVVEERARALDLLLHLQGDLTGLGRAETVEDPVDLERAAERLEFGEHLLRGDLRGHVLGVDGTERRTGLGDQATVAVQEGGATGGGDSVVEGESAEHRRRLHELVDDERGVSGLRILLGLLESDRHGAVLSGVGITGRDPPWRRRASSGRTDVARTRSG